MTKAKDSVHVPIKVQGCSYLVHCAYDANAGVWQATAARLPGLNLQAATIEELRDKLPGAISDLLE